ncbi:hypothetical protein F6X40_23955 [Paraburkholderia sp. UCT31]|uniref:hypothetical protein n=1 Tax=Paraburkholderia sp. UCT31 TaxID=2615209 RepID=UPI0016563523|nr:hypothetical protein [Paraburkholderia sp. UCT31]MBC8739771.1 hypothetical protein [Paraburkholderia sp. UCT31]
MKAKVTALARELRAVRPPVPQVRRRKDTSLGGVPVLMLSDWRWGAAFPFEDTAGVNEYNEDVAKERAQRVFQSAFEVLKDNLAGHHYEAFVCALGGGFIEGSVSLLKAFNAAELQAVERVGAVANELADGITQLSREFPEVYVPCVARQATAHDAPAVLLDKLVYDVTRDLLEGTLDNVTFDISTSSDMLFKVYDTTFLLSHADNPQRTATREEVGYDRLMLAGRGPRFKSVDETIVNGSLIGPRCWPDDRLLREDMPCQALWVTHPEKGVGYLQPVFGDALMPDSMELAPIVRAA